MERKQVENIDQYLEIFSGEVRKKLQQLRKIIQEEVPQSTEAISYAIPTFRLNGNLVHFAGHRNHIGFYPAPSGIKAFAGELKDYKTSKGAIQFPLDEPLPEELIRKIIRFRVKENLTKIS